MGYKPTKIKPIGDRVVIKPDAPEEKTKAGIYIPESAQQKPVTGVIVELGEGIKCAKTGEYLPMQTKLGDKVAYGKSMGSEVEIEGEKYLIIRESDIFMVL